MTFKSWDITQTFYVSKATAYIVSFPFGSQLKLQIGKSEVGTKKLGLQQKQQKEEIKGFVEFTTTLFHINEELRKRVFVIVIR